MKLTEHQIKERLLQVVIWVAVLEDYAKSSKSVACGERINSLKGAMLEMSPNLPRALTDVRKQYRGVMEAVKPATDNQFNILFNITCQYMVSVLENET